MDNSERGSIVVTGAFTGIGLEIARSLRGAGFRVIGCTVGEFPASAQADETVCFDLADEAQIEVAAARIGELSGGRLFGLVNNAGAALVGPTESLPLQELRRHFDINFFGAVRLTSLLLPSLLGASGRVVNISSIYGKLPLPFAWPYCASKHAFDAWSAGLRMELCRSDVRVITVRPGSVRTGIWSGALGNLDNLFWGLPAGERPKYFKMLERLVRIGRKSGETGVPASRVAGTVLKALTAASPRGLYRVGADAFGLMILQRLVPESIVERLVTRRLDAHKTELA